MHGTTDRRVSPDQIDSQIDEMVASMLNGSGNTSPSADDSDKKLIAQMLAIKPNRQMRRMLGSHKSGAGQLVGKIYDRIAHELEIKINYALRHPDDSKSREDRIREALGFLTAGLNASADLEQFTNPSEETKASAEKLLGTRSGHIVLNKSLGILYELHQLSGTFETLIPLLGYAEKIMKGVPIEFLHRVATSGSHNTCKDPAFITFIISRIDDCLRADQGRTRDIVRRIVEETAGEEHLAEQAAGLIGQMCEKLPAAYMSDSARMGELVGSMSLHAEMMPGNDAAANHNIYRLPILKNVMDLVEQSSLYAGQLFDLIFPEGQRADSDFILALAEKLPLINLHAPALADKLFARAAGQELSTADHAALRDSGVKLFDENAVFHAGEALSIWGTLLSLRGGKEDVIALVEDTFTSAQAAFPRNAVFAKAYTRAIDEAFDNMTGLQYGLIGAELVTSDQPFGYAVVALDGTVALENGQAGPAHTILSRAFETHQGDLRQAMPLTEFIVAAQTTLRHSQNGGAPQPPLRQVAIDELRQALKI